MNLSELKVDPARIEAGDWVENIPDMGDLKLKVRGIGNTDFRKLQAKLFGAIPRQKRLAGRLDLDEQDQITTACLHETVLLDWSGLEDNGQPVPYSTEMANTLLSDPSFRAFRDAVIWAANVVAEQRAEDIEDAGKNSRKRSAGS